MQKNKLYQFSILLLTAVLVGCAGCSSHMYYSEAQEYTNAVTEELIRFGICADAVSCSEQAHVLWAAGGWAIGPLQGGGVSLQVYQVSSSQVADAILERCRLVHAKHPKVSLSIVIQASSHIDNFHSQVPVVIRRESL